MRTVRNPPNPLEQARGRSRRGASLLMVVVALSVSLAVTYSFLHTQATVLQINRNAQHREAALQAAETGAALALARMHRKDWGGVAETYAQELNSTAEGTSGFNVEFRPLPDASTPADQFSVVVHATGWWQSADDPASRLERSVQVVANLRPRSDLDAAPNPGDYDQIQRYALFAGGNDGSTSYDSDGNLVKRSLTLDPGNRIEGDLWLAQSVRLYAEPNWNSKVRTDLLTSIGTMWTQSDPFQIRSPHPLTGMLWFYTYPTSGVRKDLRRIGLQNSWSQAASKLTLPPLQLASRTKYRLFAGGFEYRAVKLGFTLRNITLRPTANNPLGVFYRDGDLVLDDNVIVQGTLVCTGTVYLAGNDLSIASFNWRNAEGLPAVNGAETWPRLPAIVARDVFINRLTSRNVRVSVFGGVVVQNGVRGAGGDYDLVSAAAVDIAPGTARGRLDLQPWSTITLIEPRNLSTLTADGRYAIWLDDGISGAWHTIVGVDAQRGQLVVLGEVGQDAQAVYRYRIERNRTRFADLYGPVSGQWMEINCPGVWKYPMQTDWTVLNNAWSTSNAVAPTAFVDWLADAANTRELAHPLIRAHGLSAGKLTFSLRHRPSEAQQTRIVWAPPLFRPFSGSDTRDARAGYRWQIVSWREVPIGP